MRNRTCTVPACEKNRKGADKYCSMHRARWTRTKSLELPEDYQGKQWPIEHSFWAKMRKSDSCWEWTGAKNDAGYGQIRRGKKIFYVHRISYEMHRGEIPAGVFVDHMCRNSGCANPQHLRLATTKQNAENLSNLSTHGAISGYRGVVIERGKWRARVVHRGEVYFGGVFDQVEDALQDVIALRLKLHTHNLEDRMVEQ